MVMSHRSRQYRGHLPDHFTMMLEDDPARSCYTQRWTWSDEPDWNVEVCRTCNWGTGKQCDQCAAIRVLKRRGDFITESQQRRERRMARKELERMNTSRGAS